MAKQQQEMQMMAILGSKSEDGVEFTTPITSAPVEVPEQKSKRFPVLIVVAGIIVVIVLAVVFSVKRSRHPSPSSSPGDDGLDTNTLNTTSSTNINRTVNTNNLTNTVGTDLDTTYPPLILPSTTEPPETTWFEDECDVYLKLTADSAIDFYLLNTFALTKNDTVNNGVLNIQFPDDAANYEYNSSMSDSERYYTFSYMDHSYLFSLCFRNNEDVFLGTNFSFNFNMSHRSVNLKEYSASMADKDGVFVSIDSQGCGDYCSENVFFLADEMYETDLQYEYHEYPWYVYYDNSTDMCYCQGILNFTSWSASWLWYQAANYWNIYNYTYEYNVTMDMSIDGSLKDKVINVDEMEIKVESVEGYDIYEVSKTQCDAENDDIRINYTQVESFNISTFRYLRCENSLTTEGRPYVVHGASGDENETRLEAKSKTVQDEECDAYENWWLLDVNCGKGTGQQIENIDLNYVAQEWYSSGLTEHASIASFSGNGIRLLSIGAPSYLLIDNYKASLDEIEHAKICFTLSHYFKKLANNNNNNNESDVENRELTIPSGMDEHKISILGDTFESWNKISIETAKHGAIDETLSCIISLVKGLVFDDNQDNNFKQLLIEIAYDEARHASFAWKTLKWFEKFKSDKLDVFNRQWWKNEIDKRRSRRGNDKGDKDKNGSRMNKYGILSYDQEMKIKEMGLEKLIPQLINDCLFDVTYEENDDCPLQVIHAFMKNIVETGV